MRERESNAPPPPLLQVLVLANGAYGERMAKACVYGGIEVQVETFSETMPVPVTQVRERERE